MKDLFLHLRLNMSLVLAPIFLWGWYLSGGNANLSFWLGFIAYHIFLYGGSNAYNSYYDKDEGPIGGLKNPPKVTESLLYFSLTFKIIGLIISFFINILFFINYLICLLMSVAYSYSGTRWKSNPNYSILTVALGQGGLAFLAGWNSHLISLQPYSLFISGIFTTIFMSAGIYPLTQLYQIDEDRKRNDITFAVYWGIKRTFIFSSFCIILSSVSMLSVLYLRKSYIELGLIALVYLLFLAQIIYWAKNYKEEEIIANYDKIMRLNYTNGLGFMAYIIIHVLFFR